MAAKACFLAFLLTASVGLAQGRRQWLLIYPGDDQWGEPVELTPELWGEGVQEWSSDQDRFGSVRDHGEKIRSVCGAGVWVFYATSPKNPTDLVSEMVKLKDGDCVNLNYPVRARVKFIQHVGVDVDYNFPSLTLFKYRSYIGLAGDVRTITGKKYNVDHPHISLVITGPSSWGISGDFGSICLVPFNDNYVYASGIPDIRVPPFNLKQDSIMHIYKKCTGREDRKLYRNVTKEWLVIERI